MFYEISGPDEASKYLENLILGQRLRKISSAILCLATDDAEEVLESMIINNENLWN